MHSLDVPTWLPTLSLTSLILWATVAARFGRIGALLLAGFSVMWVLCDTTMEGRVLYAPTATHGFTSADLAGVAGFAAAVVLWVVAGRRVREDEGATPPEVEV